MEGGGRMGGPLGDGGEEEAVTWPRALQGNVRFLDMRGVIIIFVCVCVCVFTSWGQS